MLLVTLRSIYDRNYTLFKRYPHHNRIGRKKKQIIEQLKNRLDEECEEIDGIECVTCEDIDRIFLEIIAAMTTITKEA